MIDHQQSDRQPGGQHAAPQGVTTTDDYAYPMPGNPDRDEARALKPGARNDLTSVTFMEVAKVADFNAALQRAIDAVDWSQPF